MSFIMGVMQKDADPGGLVKFYSKCWMENKLHLLYSKLLKGNKILLFATFGLKTEHNKCILKG